MNAAQRDDSDDALRAIADPLERALRLRSIAKARTTLTPGQSRIYAAAIAELRGTGPDDKERLQKWIARRLGITRGRVGQILGAHRKSIQTTEAAA